MNHIIRNIGSKKLNRQYHDLERLDAIRYAVKRLKEEGYEFDHIKLNRLLRDHDMLYFHHPKLGTIEMPARFVRTWTANNRKSIGKVLHGALREVEKAFNKLKRRKHLTYAQVREEAPSKNPEVDPVLYQILIRSLKHNDVTISMYRHDRLTMSVTTETVHN